MSIDLGRVMLVPKGAYDATVAYTRLDIVTSGGSSYMCLVSNTGQPVTNATYWLLLAKAGSDGKPGVDGTPGATGPQGLQGIQGPKGDTGATGPAGPKGDKGDKGATGVQGPAGKDAAISDTGWVNLPIQASGWSGWLKARKRGPEIRFNGELHPSGNAANSLVLSTLPAGMTEIGWAGAPATNDSGTSFTVYISGGSQLLINHIMAGDTSYLRLGGTSFWEQ